MRFVALVSGGKDSIYSILESVKNGHQLVACVHLGAPESNEEESYMYQTAASEVVRTLVEGCLEVPLIVHQRVGKSLNTSMVYQNDSEGDEVEDLFLALQKAKEKYDIEAVSSGAILSNYQRVRIEHVCSRLGLTSLSYLWRLLPQKELLQRMLDGGIEAVIVRSACPPGLIPRKHLNKTLRFLWDIGLLERLHQKYQFHVCGEGGEYESLVIDSPLHKKKLVFDETVIDETDDGVGDLRIPKCHAEEKGESDIPILKYPILSENETQPAIKAEGTQTFQGTPFPLVFSLPHARQVSGGLLHISEIMAPIAAICYGVETEADLAVQEALEVLSLFKKALTEHETNPQDVIFVHLYLSEISHFATINSHYQQFFGNLLPPSRSCVAVGPGVLPGGRRVLLDCMIQKGSGEYMRSPDASSNPYVQAANATKTSILREVLHVQSISHWAPVCVGPYSQAQMLRSGLHFLAGQIGLIPCTMRLHQSWTMQLEQCWKNVASVLDALGGCSLDHMFSGLIYLSHAVYEEKDALGRVALISQKQIRENGSIIPGKVDSLPNQSELYGGYEDEGTWEEMKSQKEESTDSCPILLVSIPEMPKGAAVEVEVVSVTKGAATSLEMNDTQLLKTHANQEEDSTEIGWDAGHEFGDKLKRCNESMNINSWIRVIGHRCAATAVITASNNNSTETVDLCIETLLYDMLVYLDKVLAEARSGLSASNVLHVRLFYVATGKSSTGDIKAKNDGLQIRISLQSAIKSWAGGRGSCPSTTVVPVHAIDVISSSFSFEGKVPLFAMQALIIDPIHMETEIWIRKDRQYK